ncbi:MAG: sulfate ABC transporter permease subunit [Lachnospiraceae bacterium]|nr:sulfate ABC transporter permease subunit [Lachnospiraceae bacterium]MEE3461665.1 sulfate ABC transporter permease subunit [Lachnospiraceae bacterium]
MGLVTIDYLFIIIMLIVPLLTVVINSLKDGVRAYFKYISNPYTMSAFRLTVFASFISVIVVTVFGILAAFLLTKYNFRGKQVFASLIDIPLSISPVIAGLAYILTFGSIGFLGPFLEAHGIKIAFAVPGIVLVTIFVTFPYVFRELFPVMNAYGNDEEEAASLFGAGFFSILHSITLPNFRWALWYGVTLAFARALGEFGAVSVISGHLRGKTNTLPLQVEVLFNDFDTTASFAAASLLVITAVIILIIKSFFLKKGGQ